jgi:putative ABC transport system permease protein
MEEHLEKELRFHLEQHTADLVARGLDPAQAQRQARLALGGSGQVKEQCRDARGTRWLEDLWQDTRYALRALRQKPGFTVVALCTLALGIGSTTVMFTLINSVLLKPLAYSEPENLVSLHPFTEKAGAIWGFSYLDYLDISRESRSIALAAWTNSGGTVSKPGEPEHVWGCEISAGFFSVLGVQLQRGRAFLPEEDRQGGPAVAIISASLWRRRFGGSNAAIGMPLVLDDKSYSVVGVTPDDFLFGDADVYLPIGQDTEPRMRTRQAHVVPVFGRLRPGVPLTQARQELAVIGRRLAQQYPESDAGWSIVARPLQPELVAEVRPTLWLLLGAVGLVLIISCVNLASLLLAKAVSRSRELAMRAALGAGRGRLARQCLAESAVLGIAGGAAGILLAAAGIRPFLKLWPGRLPRSTEIHIDWHVLLFALAASLISGLLFGLAPALRVPVRELEQTIRGGARVFAGGSRRLHSAFVVSEIALAVVLLVSAGMLMRALLRLSSLDPGVNTRNAFVARIALSPAVLNDPAKIRAAWDDVLERARRVPGVASVALVDTVPMREGLDMVSYWTTPQPPPLSQAPAALATTPTPDYLKVMGIPLRFGRFFDDHDRMGGEPVIVIDEVMAQHAFGERNAVGKRIWVAGLGPGPQRIIGVVGHVRHWGLAEDDRAAVRDQMYFPLATMPDRVLHFVASIMSIAVRTTGPPLSVVEPLRLALRGAANDQVLYEVFSFEQLAGASLARQRFLMWLFGIFAGLALLLACIGIYGVLAYLTSRRVPEIGVRMALGATARDVIRMVLGESLIMIAVGVSVGIAGAWAAGRLLERVVAGMRPGGPATFAAMVVILVAAALFASFLPARRASRVDPMSALRQD